MATWACNPYQNGKGWFHERGCPHVAWPDEIPTGVVQVAQETAERREPNCKPGDPVDALGLVHAWKLVTDNGPGDIYKCERCGVTDVD